MSHLTTATAFTVFAVLLAQNHPAAADVSILPGWPVSMGSGLNAGCGSSPVAGDLDGDGDLEIVVGGRDALVHAWHHNGTPVAGWPFRTGSYVHASPALGDLDRDGRLEIAVSSNDGKLYLLNPAGQVLEGWPRLVESARPHSGGMHMLPSPSLVDLDGDGFLDVVYTSLQYRATYAFDRRGRLLAGWGQGFGENEWSGYSSAVANLDLRGRPEVITATNTNPNFPHHCAVFAWHGDGSVMDPWPVVFNTQSLDQVWTPVVGDLNGDRFPEIIVGSYTVTRVFDRSGALLAGWPRSTMGYPVLGEFDGDRGAEIVSRGRWGVEILDGDGSRLAEFSVPTGDYASPAVADIDGDGAEEIVAGAGYPQKGVAAWNADGSPVPGFPLRMGGYVYATPLLVDLDQDGDIELVTGEYGADVGELYFYVWSLQAPYRPALASWPRHQQNSANSGWLLPFRVEPFPNQAADKRVIVAAAPNPFTGSTTFTLQGQDAGRAQVGVYDLRGRRVALLTVGFAAGAARRLIWDGRDQSGALVAAGTYLVRAVGADQPVTTPVVVMR